MFTSAGLTWTFPVIQSISRVPVPRVANHPSLDQRVVNPRNGRLECVAVNLEAVYPDPQNPKVEYCFEELRAARRGWLQRDWMNSTSLSSPSPTQNRAPLTESPRKELNQRSDEFDVGSAKSNAPMTVPLNDQNDENAPPLSQSSAPKQTTSRKPTLKDDDNKTRKIRVRELKNETQTSKSFKNLYNTACS